MEDQVATVLVAGGAGEVGAGITSALLSAGMTVIVPGRARQSLEGLRERLKADERLVTVEADVVADAAEIAAARDVDAVVVSIGRWWSGDRLVDVPPETFEAVLAAGLGSHLAVARAFVPRLDGRPGAAYVMINGSGALQAVPGSGPVNVSAAAQLMLTQVLAAEHPDLRVATLLLGTPVITRSRPTGPSHWLTAYDVGAVTLEVLQGAPVPEDGVVVLDDRDAATAFPG